MDLAESKLIVLYTIHKLNFPITNNQLTNIMIENNIINYFSLQQYLVELVNSKFLEIRDEDDKHFYIVTEDGEKILNYFINMVPFTVKEKLQNIVEKNVGKIKEETQVTAEYIPESETSYTVECKVKENGTNLIELKINVPNKSSAKDICENWRNHASTIFNEVLQSLIKSRD
jgi:predicted transcriptional regulator